MFLKIINKRYFKKFLRKMKYKIKNFLIGYHFYYKFNQLTFDIKCEIDEAEKSMNLPSVSEMNLSEDMRY